MKDIKLLKQSYLESKVKEDLKSIGIIFGTTKGTVTPFSEESINLINDDILKKAKNIGATYVFGIEYKINNDSYSWKTIGYGDAYKSKEKVE